MGKMLAQGKGGDLFGVGDDRQKGAGPTLDLEVEAVSAIYTGLPQTAGLVIFLDQREGWWRLTVRY
jgi:hypothetical protein